MNDFINNFVGFSAYVYWFQYMHLRKDWNKWNNKQKHFTHITKITPNFQHPFFSASFHNAVNTRIPFDSWRASLFYKETSYRQWERPMQHRTRKEKHFAVGRFLLRSRRWSMPLRRWRRSIGRLWRTFLLLLLVVMLWLIICLLASIYW